MDEALFGAAPISVISFTTGGVESSTKTRKSEFLLLALQNDQRQVIFLLGSANPILDGL